jgi:hypothetical protein
VETRFGSSSSFRRLLERVDPKWPARSPEEQTEWVEWYARTARAIARQYSSSFRDPCHDATDLLQEIRLKILVKFGPPDAPHRLLTERPCIRNLMSWKGLDLVDWESAKRRSSHRRAPLPDADVGLADSSSQPPGGSVEVADEERAFRRAIRDPEERKAYLLFRMGRTPREVARMLGRRVREMSSLRESLLDRLADRLGSASLS